jgi:hypothetical protein
MNVNPHLSLSGDVCPGSCVRFPTLMPLDDAIQMPKMERAFVIVWV